MKISLPLVLAVVSGLALASPDKEGSVSALPDWLDTDGDGVLSEAERQAFAETRREAAYGLYRKWDSDGNGKVDKDERMAALDELKGKVRKRRCELFLSVAGTEGSMTLKEFASLPVLKKTPQNKISSMFKLLDADSDGTVSKEEFMDCVEKPSVAREEGNERATPGRPTSSGRLEDAPRRNK